ncbi:MAG: amino acid adenylation domain-containing protein [Ferruginibacter sp.]|nr:amino acid adenylation domain-containing protein [Ferruginibacter sp.]
MKKTFLPLHMAEHDVDTDQGISIKSHGNSMEIWPRPPSIPLSFSQERLWFIDRLEGSVRYHVPVVLRLKGKLNKHAVVYAMQNIVNRHEILRTVFPDKEGVAYQYILPKDGLQLTFIDGTAYLQNPKGLQENIRHLINAPFDLSKDHMLRVALISLDEREQILVMTMHQVASDDWSVSILVKELAELYSAFIENQPLQMAPLKMQYADYSVWQRNYLQGEILDKKLRYWKETLQDLSLLQIPADFSRPEDQSARGASTSFCIDELLSNQLVELSRNQGVTLFMTMLAAFKVLLNRYSGQQDICVGTRIEGPRMHEFEELIGFFEHTLPLKTVVDESFLFTELLQKVKATTLNAYKHRDAPFEKVVDAVVRQRDMNRNPLFEVMFVFRDTPELPAIAFSEIELTAESYEHTTARFDLTLLITKTKNGLDGSIEYSTDLYKGETIQQMISHFRELLLAIVKEPDHKIGALPMLTSGEEQRLLVDFNNTSVQYPKNKSIVDLFQEQVAKSPGSIALVFEQEELTYSELNERSNQLAHYMVSKGIQQEALVPICIERGVNMIIGLLAILKSGAVFIPVDPEYPLERISYMVKDTGAKIVLGSKESRLKLGNTEGLDIIEIDGDDSWLHSQPIVNLPDPVNPGQLAYVIYTSGSTGKPKGVMIPHSNVVNLVSAIINEVDFKPGSSFLSVTTFSFDICYLEFFVPLLSGGRLIVVPRETAVDGYKLAGSITAFSPTHMQGTPSTWQLLLETGWENKAALKILIGGEAVTETIKEKLTKIGMVFNLYGPTETTIWSAIKKLTSNEKVLIGKPLANNSIYILNDQLQLCIPKVAGEICIGGDGLAKGYLNQPDLTKEKFVPDPFSKQVGAKLYKTGDLGRWLPDGNIEYLGRMDNQVKIRGYRIELGEIETCLQQNEMIHQAVVIAKENNEGTKRLVTYYIPDWQTVKMKEKELYLKQVASWKEVYDTEYAEEPEDVSDEEFDYKIWKDSFTGQTFEEADMREWLQHTIDIILQEKPANVLEIGSGKGLIFYRLAGKIKKYIGTDFSGSCIHQITKRIDKGLRDYGPTDLYVCAAHEVSVGEEEEVDTIIINSVAQHFPGEDYMNDVIGKSIALLKGKGRVIIGDVRNNRLLESFKLRLDLQKLPSAVSVNELKWLAEQEVLKEEELLFSPEYFYNFLSVYPSITHIDIQLKRGSYLNELSKYRFDVIIYVGISKAVLEPEWQIWKGTAQQQHIFEQLQKREPVITLKNAPNPRLLKEKLLQDALKNRVAGTVGEIQKITDQADQEILEINEILAAARAAGYHTSLYPDKDIFKMNVLLELHPSGKFVKQLYNETGHFNNTLFTNIPLFTDIVSLLQKDIRQQLKEKLPEFMVPSEFIAIAKLPLTNNGKVDRKFLGQREDKIVANTVNYEAPRTDIEKVLVDTWQELLGIEQIGIHDNFFDLGGHSLLATRAVSALRKKLNVELFIKDIFLHPTIARLAEHVADQSLGLILPGIEIQPRPAFIPLSFSQERLWFIDRLEGSLQYHLPLVLKLKGILNQDALIHALRNLVNRHEVLRTVFKDSDGVGYQYIMPADGLQLQVVDGAVYKKDREGLWANIRQLISAPFDLSKDHMLRAALISLDEETHVFVATIHHIASDGWSESIIVKDTVEGYNAYNEGREAQLTPLEIQYADYAIWQRKYLGKELLENKMGYWKNKLQGVVPLQLPTDFARPAVQSRNGAIVNFRISKELSSALQLLSQQQGVTLFMTLLAAFKVLLYRYSGQQDICVGTPLAGRQQEELEGLIGFFINSLPLRTELVGSDSFKDLLQKVRATTLEAYDHQEVPFEKLVEAVVNDRDMSRNPLFQVMLVLLNTPDIRELRLGGLKVSGGIAESTIHNTSIFELTLFITETTRGLKCTVEYCTGLFSEHTIKKMMAHFIELLNSVVKKPEQSIGQLPMLDATEKQRLLVDFNNNHSDYPFSKTIVDLFEEQVNRYPEKIALVFEKEALSYKDLNGRANQLARYLKSRGVKKEAMVPICLERGINMIVGILAILKAGGAYVPVDPKYPADRISFMLLDTAAQIVITNSESWEQQPLQHNIDIVKIDTDWPIICAESPENLKQGIQPADLAYVIYTSGSTGRPKGVMVSQNNVVSLIKGVDYISLSAKDVLLSTGSSSFDATTLEYWGMLLNGGQLVLCTETRLLDNQLLKEEINKRGVNRMWFTSSWFNLLVDADITLFEKLETVLVGGEKLSEQPIQKLRKTYPAIEIINGYGPTENTTFSLTYRITETEINKPIPIGRPLNNRSVLILDENQQLVPVGVSGEICVGGAGLSKGYLNRPELTAEKFVPNPFSEPEVVKMYKTGDIGRWLPEGNIEYLGRMDEQVKIRGFRIELAEIEYVLQQNELVRHAVVLAKKDNTGYNRLVGYIVPAKKYDKAAIEAYLRGKVPEYMVPSLWMKLDNLPLSPNGKADKNALPDPDISHLLVNQYEAPRNKLEAGMAEIWQGLLGIETAGIHDNFFELGGHSLNAIRLVALIRTNMELDISVNDVFIYPTIAGLARNILEKTSNPSQPAVNNKYLVPVKTGGSRIPLYIVAGGGGTALRFRKFGKLLEADQPVYVLQPPIDRKELKAFPDKIEGIANKFIEEILIQNPNGPYALSGHCLGGIIAFEMARQLKARDKKVHLLAMFDTIIADIETNGPATLKNLYNAPGAIKATVSKLLFKLDFEIFLLRKHARQWVRYKMDKFSSLVDRVKRKKLKEGELEDAGLEIFDDSADIYVAACKKYKLLPYGGEIVLFYAKDHYIFLDRVNNIGFKKWHLDENTKNRWKQYAAAVSIHEIEGEHSEIFDPVHGNEFARSLQQHLDNTAK